MSDSIVVFLYKEQVPKISDLRTSVQQKGLFLEEWSDAKELLDIEGFWPGIIKNDEAGFEIFSSPIDEEELAYWEIEKEQLGDRDTCIDLSFYNELDVVAASLCASYLCRAADGLTLDDDGVPSINSQNCEVWAQRIIDDVMNDLEG